jgi:hypothetical protein
MITSDEELEYRICCAIEAMPLVLQRDAKFYIFKDHAQFFSHETIERVWRTMIEAQMIACHDGGTRLTENGQFAMKFYRLASDRQKQPGRRAEALGHIFDR